MGKISIPMPTWFGLGNSVRKPKIKSNINVSMVFKVWVEMETCPNYNGVKMDYTFYGFLLLLYCICLTHIN